MSTRLIAKKIQLWEGEPLLLVARIETAGGTPLTSSQVSSVRFDLFDFNSTTPHEAVYSQSPIDATTVYFDTLQHDDAENLLGDSGGYNFKFIMDSDTFHMDGGKTYRAQVQSVIGNSSNYQVYDVIVGEIL